MKKSTKGAVAAAAAAVLLLGGAGSLAFWTDEATLDGTDITAGYLKLINPDCGDDWLLDGGTVYTTQILVPGDTLTKVCSYEVDASGDHLTATFDVEDPTFTNSNGLTDELTTDADYKVNTVAVTTFPTAVEEGDIVEATIVVDWPYGVEDNGSNQNPGLTTTLNDIVVTATQFHTP